MTWCRWPCIDHNISWSYLLKTNYSVNFNSMWHTHQSPKTETNSKTCICNQVNTISFSFIMHAGPLMDDKLSINYSDVKFSWALFSHLFYLQTVRSAKLFGWSKWKSNCSQSIFLSYKMRLIKRCNGTSSSPGQMYITIRKNYHYNNNCFIHDEPIKYTNWLDNSYFQYLT